MDSTTEIKFTRAAQLLHRRFRGVLVAGAHTPAHQACALELAHAACGDPWSDRPDRWPDLRPLNDAPWSSDALRTTHMMRVLKAYWDWNEWSVSRRQRCVDALARETVRQVVTGLPGLSAAASPRVAEARAAVGEAWAAAMGAMGDVAALAAAAGAAAWAARAAGEAADRILILACGIWIEAAQASIQE